MALEVAVETGGDSNLGPHFGLQLCGMFSAATECV